MVVKIYGKFNYQQLNKLGITEDVYFNKIEENMKPIINKEFNNICNVVYPITKYINELGDSYQDLGNSCILINFLSKKNNRKFAWL